MKEIFFRKQITTKAEDGFMVRDQVIPILLLSWFSFPCF